MAFDAIKHREPIFLQFYARQKIRCWVPLNVGSLECQIQVFEINLHGVEDSK